MAVCLVNFRVSMNVWIYLLYLVMTSLSQELEFDLEDIINDDFGLQGEHSQSLRSGEDIYTSHLYAADFLREFNNELRQWKHSSALADWTYATNITAYNQMKREVNSDYDQWFRRRLSEARKFNQDVMPDSLRRQLALITHTATSDDEQVNRRKDYLLTTMQGLYGSSRVCLTEGYCVPLEPNLVNIMATSRDPSVLQQVWQQWQDGIGQQVKPYFTQLVDVLNQGAVENGFTDYGQFWKQNLFFNTSDLDTTIRELWADLKPLYLQLHAYVRRKLRGRYGSNVVGQDGSIPAHLLGNMWAQHWTDIADIVSPYPEFDQWKDIEARLKRKMDVPGMFRIADSFYTSIGLSPMTSTFWRKSMFQRPRDRDVVCHASSFDMFYPGDFRIKMCAEMTIASFLTVHHEMGHVQYFMAYADQPTIFRDGANAAFQEAVGDTIQLSVMSDTHLRGLGLIGEDNIRDQNHKFKRTINKLLNMALEKVAFLPFGLLLDLWRWDVMSGVVNQTSYNRRWWELRLQYQGLRSPVPRSELNFDPGAKYHVASNSPYISYFISYIQQFQMFKSLCELSGFTGPLYECDFYGSNVTGRKLKHMLSFGASVQWQEQLHFLTGSSRVTSRAILEYFQPLYNWLLLDNSKHDEAVGWDQSRINWVDQ